ncbi:hypothetical protein ACUOCP_50120, partial [Escherichia sp. R-CC3]
VKEAWNNNESVFAIGEKMQRDPDEVALLIMDLARKGVVQTCCMQHNPGFLQHLSSHLVTPTYAVEFFDQDEKQKLHWFEVNTEAEAKEEAEKTYG